MSDKSRGYIQCIQSDDFWCLRDVGLTMEVQRGPLDEPSDTSHGRAG